MYSLSETSPARFDFSISFPSLNTDIMNKLSQTITRAAFALILYILTALPILAGEGMWLPLLLKSLNEAEMKSMGMKMSAEDIYSVNQGSLKDAIVHFNGGCTAEVISDQGLILTNHHCGYGAIQNHSTLEDYYLRDGFWAKSLAEELPNPGYFAQFIVSMHDVTHLVLAGVTDAMTAAERQSMIDVNSKSATSSIQKESWQEISVKPFYDGLQYYAFVTETYKDVRLVGAPPESIGKFGADTDNWVWPRHTGDFAVFRIYAGPDNKPAEYSADNKPLKPRHYLPISMDGIEEGDFTLVFGFPGKTTQYLPSFAVAQTIDILDPARVGVRNLSLGIMDKHMRQDEGVRLAYSSKYAGLSNSWKKWIGEMQGLKSTRGVAKKEKQEMEFNKKLQSNPAWQAAYGDLLPKMKKVYADLDPILHNRTIMAEVIGGGNIELFKLTALADRLAKAYKDNGDTGYNTAAARAKDQLTAFFKDYRKDIDMEVFNALMEFIALKVDHQYLPPSIINKEATAASIFGTSILADQQVLTAALDKGGASFTAALSNDPAYQLYLTLKGVMDKQLTPALIAGNDQLTILQKNYMAALIEVNPEKRYWPDANSTLRVTYGQVEPFSPKDGMMYKTQTYLDGVMEKYVPGDYEFDVPAKLIELYEKKDYGPYGENGKMPLAFIASNHTTGGNSGSPAIDASGNLIGINFDRVWEGTMSDLYYDKSLCRNIMVDIRYVLFIIDKLGGAGYLVDEMTLVHPKAGMPKKKKK
jgi:hypothetical protein